MLIHPQIINKAPAASETNVLGHAVGAFISTPQPNNSKVEVTLSATLVTANAYEAAAPTFAVPASSGQTALLYGPGDEDPNVVKITPFAGANNVTSPTMRVIGWNGYPWTGTNLVAFSETFATSGATGTSTNWVDSNITRDSTLRADPLGNTTALRITAAAANATITNAVASPALSNANRAFSIWMRRVTGTGTIEWTMTGGTTWTAQAITASWVRYTFNATSVTSIGIRIVTSGDAIEVWGAQVESGTGATQYLRTTSGSASATQTLYVPNLLAELTLAYNATAGSIPVGDFDGSRRHFLHSISAASGVPAPNIYTPGTAAAAGVPSASILIDTVGSQFVTAQFKANTASAIMGAFWHVI